MNSESIKRLSVQSGVELAPLQCLASTPTKYTANTMERLVTQHELIFGFATRSSLYRLVPIIRIVTEGILSYGLCVKTLLKILNDYTNVAFELHAFI